MPTKPPASARRLTTTDIFLYIPNLIGYLRVILALASLFYMQWHPKYCTVLYGVSCLLDALDGHAARKFHQTSKFGAILDMVTDRCTTSCLICYLCVAYPAYAVVFQLLTSLDLASHYMHMYATMSSGNTSHKKVDQKTSWILNLYYTNNLVLFFFCAFNELFFVAIYLLSFPQRANSFDLGNLFGLESIPLSFPLILAIVTFPLWLGKQIINVVQMVKAAVMLAEGDVEEKNAKIQ